MPDDAHGPSRLDTQPSMPPYIELPDDIAFGDGRILVVVGGRRLIASGLTHDDVEGLKKAYRTGGLRQSILLANVLHGISHPADRAAEEASRRWILLHSINLQGPVRLLSKLVEWRWMVPMTIAVLFFAASRPVQVMGGIVVSLRLIAHPSVSTYPIVIATVAGLALLHELAHLAACYRFSGIVGSLGFFLGKRSGGLCADVSAMTRLPSALMAKVYLAGPTAQALASVMLLVSPIPSLRIAGLASLLLCAVNLVPVPGTDGYHALAAALGTSGGRRPFRGAN